MNESLHVSIACPRELARLVPHRTLGQRTCAIFSAKSRDSFGSSLRFSTSSNALKMPSSDHAIRVALASTS